MKKYIKQETQVYHISFRWSTQDQEDKKEYDEIIHNVITKIFDKYIYQLENTITATRNNYHYQGYGHLKNKQRPKALASSLNGQVLGIQMSAASNEGLTALREYCIKERSRVRGPWYSADVYRGEGIINILYEWQTKVQIFCTCKPDDRSINVIVDPRGNSGKSAFAKYMAFHHGVPCLGWGKTGDLLYLVSEVPNKKAYFFDLSRTKPQDWASGDIYAAIEGIKNGHFVNTKYKCKTVLMQSPHIWIFTNSKPNLSFMSVDRWHLWEIVDKDLKIIYA